MTRKKLWLIVGGAAALVVILAGIVFALTSSGSSKSSDSDPAETTTTTTAPPPVWPLTGLPDVNANKNPHPAVVVKVDNSPDSRPQTGINEADIVYELLVEGITRYALVYHSNMVDPVGPVRSARSSDIELVANLSTPLFAWSGANGGVMAEVAAAARKGILIDASNDTAAPAYYRSNERRAPHNLYVQLPQLLELKAPEKPIDPAPIFTFRTAGATSAVTPSTSSSSVANNSDPTSSTSSPVATTTTLPGLQTPGFTLNLGGVSVDYVWNPTTKGWSRLQVDQTHPRAKSATLDTAGVQVSPANVIVQFIEYGQSPSDSRSPMALTVGSGSVLVFTDGRVIAGTWSRPSAEKPTTYTGADGLPILLTPGRTWVALPRAGSAISTLDEATAAAFLAIKG
ncbi:MAG: DUF3048 domain-containing protein [Acidimicrobiales bacterium]